MERGYDRDAGDERDEHDRGAEVDPAHARVHGDRATSEGAEEPATGLGTGGTQPLSPPRGQNETVKKKG